MTTSTTNLAKLTKAQLIEMLNAQPQVTAQTVISKAMLPVNVPAKSSSNTLGTKCFARDILEIVNVDALWAQFGSGDYRSDEEVAQRIQLSEREHHARASKYIDSLIWARRSYWATKFSIVAKSQAEYVAPVSGMWPTDYSFEMDGQTFNVEFGAKVAGTYVAIY